jgi:hypothetical protein
MRPDLSEIGSTGLNHVGGFITENDIASALRGDAWRKNVIAMTEQGAIVGAMLFAIEMIIRRVEWQIVPASEDDEQSLRWSDFTKTCFDDMSTAWSDTISEIVTMLPWGFSPLEVVYKYRNGDHRDPRRRSKFDDGLVGWRKWPIRSQGTVWRWMFDDDGGIDGLVQNAPPQYQYTEIPIEKLLLFRTKARQNNPEGRSVLRNAYVSWYYRNNIQRIEAIGIERDMAGLPVAHVPARILSSTADTADVSMRSTIKDIVTSIKRDQQEGVVWPSDTDENGNQIYRLELLSSGGMRQFDTDAIIARYDQRIAMTLLADFILLGHEQVGSHALSQDKTDIFVTAIEAWLQSIADVINRFAIPKLMHLNGVHPDLHPKFLFGDVQHTSMQQLCDYVAKLTGANLIVPDDELEAHLRQAADLPPIPEGRELPTSVEDEAMSQAAMRVLARGY